MLAPTSLLLEKLRLLGEGEVNIPNNERIRKTKKVLFSSLLFILFCLLFNFYFKYNLQIIIKM